MGSDLDSGDGLAGPCMVVVFWLVGRFVRGWFQG